jgi:hypothetical protein
MSRVFISAFFVLALLAPLAATLYPAEGDHVAVFTGGAPEVGAARIVAAAHGHLVGTRPWAVIARADAPGFARRLYAAGAILVVRAAPGLCAPSRSTPT